MRFPILIETDKEGLFVAEVPGLPGGPSPGRTRSRTLGNHREATVAHLESLDSRGEAVPPSISEEIEELDI